MLHSMIPLGNRGHAMTPAVRALRTCVGKTVFVSVSSNISRCVCPAADSGLCLMLTASGGWFGSELPTHELGGTVLQAWRPGLRGAQEPAYLPQCPGVQSWPDPLMSPLSSWPRQDVVPGRRSLSPPASWLLAQCLASSGRSVTASTGRVPVGTAR